MPIEKTCILWIWDGLEGEQLVDGCHGHPIPVVVLGTRSFDAWPLGCRLGWTAMISEKAQRSQFLLFLRKNRQTESCVGHFSEGTGTPEPSFRFSVMGGRQQIRIAVA